jgi:hypothetical protein
MVAARARSANSINKVILILRGKKHGSPGIET